MGLSDAVGVAEGTTLLGDASGEAVTSGVGDAFGLNTVGIGEGSPGVAVGEGCGDSVGAAVGINAVPTP